MSSDHHDDGRRDRDGEGSDRDSDRLAGEGPEQSGDRNSGPGEDGDAAPYKVGYGRPPMHSRVVKGQVLNPGGRHTGSKNKPKEASPHETRAIILKSAKRMLRVKEAGEAVTVSMVEAVVRSLEMAALKGNVWAMWRYLGLVRAEEREESAARATVLAAVIEYKLKWDAEFKRRATFRIKGPDPVPHPDDFVIEEATGTVHARGPATEEEIARWKRHREVWTTELNELRAQRDARHCRNEGEIEISAEIESEEEALNVIEAALGGSRKAMLALQRSIPED